LATLQLSEISLGDADAVLGVSAVFDITGNYQSSQKHPAVVLERDSK